MPATDYVNEDEYHLFVVFTNPKEGREHDFHEWYKLHVRDVTNAPGFKWGRRYVLDPDQRPGQSSPWHYLALYGFVGDVNEIHAQLKQADDSGAIANSDAYEDYYVAWVYSAIGPKISRADRPSGAEGDAR
ncbi:MAG: hypothetical protein LBK59_08390 [Bifidobacteriaceae bacterium]|jgi:hypothetical protein|nr:hypothetical protein [Bifidobacteriaceae bacterium]